MNAKKKICFIKKKSFEMACAFKTGLCHENTWIGLNDRMVEDDFQWTDNMDLVRLAHKICI